MRLSYKAWVPTVNGRLSFRVIGETHYPTRPQYANLRLGSHQYVVVRQVRNTSDVLFRRILSKIFGLEGDFEYFLAARARIDRNAPDAKLIGKLYLFRTFSEKRRLVHNRLGVLFSRYRKLERNPFSEIKLRETYIATHRILFDNAEISADVILARNGVITITDVRWHDQELLTRSVEYAEHIHSNIDADVADQLYFFVRDIAHHHQHHSPDADTIITAYAIYGDDNSWYNDVLYSLYFHIIATKRRESFSEQVRALGVLAYIRSFEEIAIADGCNLPTFNRQATKESIEASRAYLDWNTAQSRQRLERSRTVVFWLAGFMLAAISFIAGFSTPETPTHPLLVAAANFLKVHPLIILLPVALVIMYSISSVLFKLKVNWWRDATRTALVNRKIALSIIIAIILVLAIILGSRLSDLLRLIIG